MILDQVFSQVTDLDDPNANHMLELHLGDAEYARGMTDKCDEPLERLDHVLRQPKKIVWMIHL